MKLMDRHNEKYKVALKDKYVGDKKWYGCGDVFKKNSTVGYKGVEGIEFTLNEIGKLVVAVDKMFYDIDNHWEKGMNIEELVRDLRQIMYSKVKEENNETN